MNDQNWKEVDPSHALQWLRSTWEETKDNRLFCQCSEDTAWTLAQYHAHMKNEADSEMTTKNDMFYHVEGLKRDEWPKASDTDEKLASLSKAWPYLNEHARHMDGEFNNAHNDLRRMIDQLRRDRDRAVSALLLLFGKAD